LLTKYWAFSEH